MTFKPHFWTITILSLIFITFRVSHFPVSHLTYKTVKLGLQNTLNMSKTTRVYFGVLHMGARPPHPPPSMARMASPPIPQITPVVVQRSTEVIQSHATILFQTIGASDDRIQRVEHMLRQLRVAEGMDVWDGFDSAPMTPLLPKFWMLDMERYTCRGCPSTHLRIYSLLMRGMGLDEAQLIMLFPLSLSDVAQSWFSTLDASHRRT